MKRFTIVLFAVLFLFAFSSGIFADDASYDWEIGTDADYNVYVATTDGGVNLRYDATTDSGIICLIPDCVKLHISRESSNGWGYTEYNGQCGWIALSQVSRSYPVKEVSKTVVVSAKDGVNLRGGPCVSYSKLISSAIPTGTKLTVTGLYTVSGWGQTSYNGVSGWIAMSEVKDYVPEPEEENTEEEPEEDTEITDTETNTADVPLVETDDNTDSFATIIYILMGLIVVILATAAVIIIRLLKK